jgi:hypothetical protein
MTTSIVSTIRIDGHDLQWAKRLGEGGFAGCLRFLFGTRAKCEREVLNRGSVAADRVTSNLEYLVVGSLVEPTWAHTSYGRKIEKAIEYIDKGCGIAIISERQWIEALK